MFDTCRLKYEHLNITLFDKENFKLCIKYDT